MVDFEQFRNQRIRLCSTRLKALRENLPAGQIPEAMVDDFNNILLDLREWSEISELVDFLISADRLEAVDFWGKKKCCDRDYFRQHFDALWEYLNEHTATKEFMPKKVDREPMKSQSEQSPHITVHGDVVNSQLHSHGSSLTINYKSMQAEVLHVLSSIESRINELELRQSERADLLADVGTVRAQVSASHPKNNIIRESLHSIRHILEHAAGATIAHPLILEIMKLLSR